MKSRERPGDNDARERSWIAKKIAEGTRQVSGTARSLGAKVTTVTNGRGRGLKLDGSKVSWTGVVIIDHPSPPESFELAQEVLPVPTVVLLRRDWEFLFHQLKSTYAVVDYLRRVETSAEELGGEPFRYFELAAADLEAESPPLSFELKAPAVRISGPRLPSAPAGVEDPVVHGLFRMMLEDIAVLDVDGDEATRVALLAELDSVPVVQRAELGRILLASLADDEIPNGSVKWRFRTFVGLDRSAQLLFGVCSKFDEHIQEAFKGKVLLRYYDRLDGASVDNDRIVGVLLTPRSDGHRDWDTTMIAVLGDPGLTEADVAQYRQLWERDAESTLG